MALQTMNVATGTTGSLQPRPFLRRAVYIHVSDLTSAYNIDHKKLQTELNRVHAVASGSKESSPGSSGGSTEDDRSTASFAQKRLQPPRGGFNLCVLVGNVKVVVDKLRVDRTRVRLAEVEVGDETGAVSLRARDEQIDVLRQISERSGAVVLRNCTLELYQGKHIRLSITKWGKMSAYPDNVPSTPPPPSKINRDRNYSLINLSLVASEMVENEAPEAAYQAQSRDSSGADRSRQSGQGRQHQQHSSRRGSGRERRQPRQQQQRSIGVNPLAVPFPELQGMGNQMANSPYPGYSQPSYREGMDVPLFPYGSGQQQRAQQGSPHSQTSLLLMQQQYEMQQRHIQQMQAFHEQEGRRQQMMQGSSMLVPNVLSAAPSFDTQGDYSRAAPPLTPSPLIPVPMQGPGAASDQPEGQAPGAVFPALGHQSSEGGGFPGSPHVSAFADAQSSLEAAAVSPDQGGQTQSGWGGPSPGSGFQQPSFDSNAGRMNPGAQSFAPSYAQLVMGQGQGYTYPQYRQEPQQQQQTGAVYGSQQHQQQLSHTGFQQGGPGQGAPASEEQQQQQQQQQGRGQAGAAKEKKPKQQPKKR